MTTPIPMDDLRPDCWVTIRDEIQDLELPPFAGGDVDFRLMWRQMRARTPVKPGTPMRVIAVDLPFLYLVVLNAEGQENGPLILDLRRHAVVGICTSVPEAILEFADVKLRSNYEHSLATAATEAAVEAKAELVKLDLLSEATETGGEGGGEAHAETSVKPNNRDSRSANHRQHAESSSEEHPPYDNGDESEPTDEDSLDRWFRGDEDGEAA
ncbi:MAG: hypothetical protein GWP75_11360 [Planctomycetia bacterium]|nr:hypothetical protein [Planctomycetia bacterium]